MKKLFNPIALFILTGMIFSSCSNTSKLSFTKRHYRSGYFVDRVGKNHTVVSNASIPTKVSHPNKPVVTVKLGNKAAINNAVVSVKYYLDSKIASSQNIKTSDNRPTHSNTTGKNIFIINTNATNKVTESPGVNTIQTLSESNNSGGDSAAGAALSLLWIVIVVILILFLVGILSGGWGLGGLLYILLLIALVLLILWLLRIA